MRILITGGAGFIGSHITERLLARGDEVHVIDNFATGRRDNLRQHTNLNVVEGTIADRELVGRVFDGFVPEMVVHAAASYKDPTNWIEDAQTNVLGGIQVIQASQRVGVRRFIYFQTALCYGLHPLEHPITLRHPISPEGSSYAVSKTVVERYLALSGLEYLTFRLANAYGPRNLSGPLPTFFHRLTTGKPCFVMKTRRDFVFVNDLVDVVIKALDGMGSKGSYHISSGRDYSIKELFDATVNALGISLSSPVQERDRNPDDAFSILLDPAETNETFDWRATTLLGEGVRKTVAYYQEYGITETYTHLKLPGITAHAKA